MSEPILKGREVVTSIDGVLVKVAQEHVDNLLGLSSMPPEPKGIGSLFGFPVIMEEPKQGIGEPVNITFHRIAPSFDVDVANDVPFIDDVRFFGEEEYNRARDRFLAKQEQAIGVLMTEATIPDIFRGVDFGYPLGYTSQDAPPNGEYWPPTINWEINRVAFATPPEEKPFDIVFHHRPFSHEITLATKVPLVRDVIGPPLGFYADERIEPRGDLVETVNNIWGKAMEKPPVVVKKYPRFTPTPVEVTAPAITKSEARANLKRQLRLTDLPPKLRLERI